MIDKYKFFGKEDDYPIEHLTPSMELVEALSKDGVKQHYYFLKLFPFLSWRHW
jgi:hypothetical protein